MSNGTVASSALIHHSQVSNAFGEVVQETDSKGNVTDLTYSNMGKLLSKQAPLTSITLENGFVKNVRPTTTYIYDTKGRLIATTDANGNLTTQTFLGGSEQVLRQFNVNKSYKAYGYDIFGDLRSGTDELKRRTDYTYDLAGQLKRIDRPERLDSVGHARAYEVYDYDAAGNRIRHTTTDGVATVR